jgi:hypothetical protein
MQSWREAQERERACHSLQPDGKASRPPVKTTLRLAAARCRSLPLGLDGARPRCERNPMRREWQAVHSLREW